MEVHMFLIPLLSKRSDLEYAQSRNDIFDLLFDPAPVNIYLGLVSDGIRVAGIGEIPQKSAYQYHTRDWRMGYRLDRPKAWGNVGFMGDFKNVDDAVSRTFPWKGEESFCLNNGRVVEYTGQKLKANKLHWTYIEPIMCVLSDTPAGNLEHFLKVLGYRRTEDFRVRGNWRTRLTLFCDGEEVGLDTWYLEFTKRIIY